MVTIYYMYHTVALKMYENGNQGGVTEPMGYMWKRLNVESEVENECKVALL